MRHLYFVLALMVLPGVVPASTSPTALPGLRHVAPPQQAPIDAVAWQQAFAQILPDQPAVIPEANECEAEDERGDFDVCGDSDDEDHGPLDYDSAVSQLLHRYGDMDDRGLIAAVRNLIGEPAEGSGNLNTKILKAAMLRGRELLRMDGSSAEVLPIGLSMVRMWPFSTRFAVPDISPPQHPCGSRLELSADVNVCLEAHPVGSSRKGSRLVGQLFLGQICEPIFMCST